MRICCAVCGVYLGKYVGEYPGEFLPVCPTCHSILREERKERGEVIS
jgi:hypothetical protein